MDEEEMDDDLVAQAMGFASFGAQPNKRRKFNPHVEDAVVAPSSATLALHQARGASAAGSGSNATPLGERRLANKDEISLDDDDDDGDDNAHDAEPQHIDTSVPPSLPAPSPATTTDQVQSQIDSVLGVSTQPSTTSGPGHHPAGQESVRGQGGGRGGHQPPGHHDGKPWWSDYYDPASNTNPWEKLEKERGMAPRDAWLTWEESKARWEDVKASLDQDVSS
jgi:hypothetical protein